MSIQSRSGSLLEAVDLSAVQFALLDSDHRVLRVGSGIAIAIDETQYVCEVWCDVCDAEPLCFLAATICKRAIIPVVQV
jgi:hypothetical protein